MWLFGDSFFERYGAISRSNLKLTASVVAWDMPKGKNVKKIFLTTTALIALGIAPAAAADMAARPYTKAPVAVAMYNWSGFYAGIFKDSSGVHLTTRRDSPSTANEKFQLVVFGFLASPVILQ